MATNLVDTRKAHRRVLKFASIADLVAELDAIERAHSAGTLRATGNWHAGQICDHMAKIWEFSLDGFPAEAKPPLWVIVLCRPFKWRAASGSTLRAGFTLPPEAAFMLPTEGCTVESGLARIRKAIARVTAGERCEKRSPLFGSMSHTQWLGLHFGHAQLHLSFLHYA